MKDPLQNPARESLSVDYKKRQHLLHHPWLLFSLFILVSFAAGAQNTVVTGKVTDASTGQPLSGVSIQVKGTTMGASTDNEGNFSIEVAADDAVLSFSSVGYENMEESVNGRARIDISMTSSTTGLDEVVVIGYGTQKKENVVGSIATVNTEELSSSPVGMVSNALAGRLPGGVFMQTSGEPGRDASTIRIRGNSTLNENSPLVVIDGIPGRDLNSLNPEDIQSISVLKDASAAIYGARAANGVILVTTKVGRKDQAPSLNYDFYYGFLSPSQLPKMTDAPTYATMIREMQSYRGVPESSMTFSEEDVEKFRSGEYPWTHPNTDWFKEALKNHSNTQHNNVSVSGGGSKVSYFASFGAQSDDGIFKNSATSFKKYNLRLNLNADINKYLNLGINLSANQENRNYPTKSTEDIFEGLTRMYPTSPALIPGTNLPGPDIEYGDQPMISASSATGFDNEKVYKLDNIFTANLKIPGVEGLMLSSYFAYDQLLGNRKLFQKPWTLYSLDVDSYLNAGNTGKEDGLAFVQSKSIGYPEPRVTNFSDQALTKTWNVKMGYSRVFNNRHNLDAFVAYEQSEDSEGEFSAFRRYFISTELPYLFAGGDAEKDNDETVGIDSRVNYFGRIDYNYDLKYYFQMTFRRDGSLRFSKESGRWGNFPSFLVGYRPSGTDWWRNNVGFVNDLKLRASWGKLGNDQIAPFQYLTSFGFSGGYTFGDNKQFVSGLDQSNIPNPLITWEVSRMINFGFDAIMLKNKLSLTVDLFDERRSDILVHRNASVPIFTGISLPDENFGIVENKGVELMGTYRDSWNSFRFELSGNFAFARNKVIEFDEPEQPVPWQVKTGHPMNALLLYKMVGVFRDEDEVNKTPHVTGARPGDIIIEDVDGDGKITANDRQLFPFTTTPEITYGFSLNLGFKNWDLSVLFQGQGRAWRSIYTDDRHGSSGNYYQFDADGRWTPDNPDASKPRTYERLEEYWRSDFETQYNYANVSFLRLKNLQVSYRIPTGMLEKTKVFNGIRIYASGQNLWLVQNGSKIMDPETDGMGAYPIMKVVAIGAQVTF